MHLKKTVVCVALSLFVGTTIGCSGGGEASIEKPTGSDKEMMDEVMKEMAEGYKDMSGGEMGKQRRGP